MRHHKATGQGYVVLNGKVLYLGKYGRPDTLEKYHQAVAEWLSCNRQLPTQQDHITVKEMLARFWVHAQQYYRHADGTPTSEVDNLRQAMRPLKEVYANKRVVDFGPRWLRTVRQNMIDRGWCRSHINKSVSRLKSIFKWAVGEELIPASVYHALLATPGLKRGRSDVREAEPVKPIDQASIDAIKPFVSNQVWTLVQLQLLTAARPGELITMRPGLIDTSKDIWIYIPSHHKTAHHGYERRIYLGPRAQEILQPFLQRSPDKLCFSPAEAEAQRLVDLHANRRTPLSRGNLPGTNRKANPRCRAGEAYTVATYRRAIGRACDRAFPPPAPLAKREDETNSSWKQRINKDRLREKLRIWRNKHRWHPHQLRHNAATYLRKEFGLETARVILGHRSTAVTEVYAELDHEKALQVIRTMG